MHAGTHHCVNDDLQSKMPPPTSVHLCIEFGGGIFEHLLWDVPDVDEPGFCPLQISNTMVSTCMHVVLVVMLFIT